MTTQDDTTTRRNYDDTRLREKFAKFGIKIVSRIIHVSVILASQLQNCFQITFFLFSRTPPQLLMTKLFALRSRSAGVNFCDGEFSPMNVSLDSSGFESKCSSSPSDEMTSTNVSSHEVIIQSVFNSAKSTMETPELCVNNEGTKTTRCHVCVFIFNFEQISHIVLVFPLLTLNK